MKDYPLPVHQANMTHVSELVTRAREGDRLAFDRLVELYAPAVYNLALRITRNREEAEDCVQEAFVRAYTGLRHFRGEAAFSTWLYRVTFNVAREAAKKHTRHPLTASELMEVGSEETPELDRLGTRETVAQPDPEESLLTRQKREVIMKAIDALPEHQRTVILLYDVQGLSYEEVAGVLQVRVGTVKSRLNRARLALREALTKQRELLCE